MIENLLRDVGSEAQGRRKLTEVSLRRAKALRASAFPKQRAIIDDPARYKAGRTARRTGKTRGMSTYALVGGEENPGYRVLIISLTLKHVKQNYWHRSPSGVPALGREFGLNLEYNDTDMVWTHENGSSGRLAGAETHADIERLRGSDAEADLVIVDECKSFPVGLLHELIEDVLRPGLMTRGGTLVLVGTPGSVPGGDFYQATYEGSVTGEGEASHRTCVPWDQRDSKMYKDMEPGTYWSLHTWGIQDNRDDRLGAKHPRNRQWQIALADKKLAGWADDHPTWRREYLGEWTVDASGLVYAYSGVKAVKPGVVTWIPEATKGNPTGLPQELGPWHLVMGVDFGFEDATAVVVAGYSERVAQMRHVWDSKAPHLTVDGIAAAIQEAIDLFGVPEVLIGDAGGLGKTLVESLNTMYGLPVIKADKSEKQDYIELLNADFHAGRLKLVPGTGVEDEMSILQWDLGKDTKARLVRKGRLKEDPSYANHACDALLYTWRFCYHNFARPEVKRDEPGTAGWLKAREREEVERLTAQRAAARGGRQPLPPAGQRPLNREDAQWMNAGLSRTKPSWSN